MQTGPDIEWITAKDVAELIGVSLFTVYSWARKGTGPGHYRVNGRSIRYDRAEVLAWREAQRQTPVAS